MKDVPPNPVGYQNKDVARLLSNQIVTFEKVGGEGSDITEFVPVDADGEKLSGVVTTQFYSDRGKLEESYTWCLGEDVDDGMPDGWYDGDMEEPKSRELNFGEGFKVYTTYTGASLSYAGEVDVEAVAIPIPRLLSSMGNVRPCGIKETLKNKCYNFVASPHPDLVNYAAWAKRHFRSAGDSTGTISSPRSKVGLTTRRERPSLRRLRRRSGAAVLPTLCARRACRGRPSGPLFQS